VPGAKHNDRNHGGGISFAIYSFDAAPFDKLPSASLRAGRTGIDYLVEIASRD